VTALPVLAAGNVDRWLWWDWIDRNTDLVTNAVREHIVLTVWSVGIGLVIALPLGVAAARWRRLYPPALAITGALYTIPSLALFAFLVPYTGLSRTTAIIPLVSYTLLILVRNVVAGLDGVPADILDAADGMGYGRTARLLRVELPLALPAIMAGIRIATVTTVGLVTVAAIIGLGGLGQLILVGLNRPVRTAVLVGAVLSVAFAVVADVSLMLLQRRLTPWAREEA
jgi:osmoprotectant transport system permease protein